VRNILRLEGLHGGNGGVHRVAVIGATAAIEPAVFVFGRPGAEIVAPAIELGLFVQMAVHQGGLVGSRLGAGDLEEQHWCAR
jgi:hypothetical protein